MDPSTMPTEAPGSELLKTEAPAPQDGAGEAGRRPEPDDEEVAFD